MLDWNDLRALGVVAREGSLLAASRVLNVHPTTVGRRVTALEHEVGQRLIVREGRRGVSLTSAGRELVAPVLPVLDTLDGIARRALGRSAPIRVAATPNAARVLAAGLDFAALDAEGLTVELLADTRAADLTRGEADLAIRILVEDHPTLVRKRVGVVRYGLYASPRYRSGAPIVVDDGLRGHRVAKPSGVLATAPDAGWLATHGSASTTLVRSSDYDALAEAVAGGDGLAVLPVSVAAFYPLRRIVLLEGLPERVIWLVYHQDLRRDARVQRVAREVTAVIAQAQEAPRASGSPG